MGTSVKPIALGGATDVGRARENNEDSYGLWGAEQGWWDCLIAVADGVGGHEHGKQASELVLSHFVSDLASHEPSQDDANIKQALLMAVAAANEAVYGAFSDAGAPRPGSTFTCALVVGQKCYVAHVGDSRAYMIHAAQAYRLTTDHSWVQHQVSLGHMTEEEAAASPYRNQILRVLGSHPQVEADVVVRSVAAGDLLVVCSDGVSEYVEDQELVTLANAATDANDLAESLVALAVARGGSDNATAVVAGIPVPPGSGGKPTSDTDDLNVGQITPPTVPGSAIALSREPREQTQTPTRPLATAAPRPSRASSPRRAATRDQVVRGRARLAAILAALFIMVGVVLLWISFSDKLPEDEPAASASAPVSGASVSSFRPGCGHLQAWPSCAPDGAKSIPGALVEFSANLAHVPEPLFLRQYPLMAPFRHQQADYYLLADLVST